MIVGSTVAENRLGEVMQARRMELKKMSQTELGLRAGLSQSDISKIESGAWRPSDEVVARIAVALEDDYDRLILARSGVVHSRYIAVGEGDVAYDAPQVIRVDIREGESVIAVLPEWLDGRAPEQCFILRANDSSLAHKGIPLGFLVLFARLNGETPDDGDVVATNDEHGWWMFVWDPRTNRVPIGRKLKVWEP